MSATDLDEVLRHRLHEMAPAGPVDADVVLGLVQRRRGRHHRRRVLGRAGLVAAVLVVAGALTGTSLRRAHHPVRLGSDAASGGHIDAQLLWIGSEEGPTLADPNSGRTTAVGPAGRAGRWCNTCPLVRVGDRAFVAMGGRLYAYDRGASALRDIGTADAVFPTSDGDGLMVAGAGKVERRSVTGETTAGPWSVPPGYELTFPPRATATGVLVQSGGAFVRTLAEWAPATGAIRSLRTYNQLIDVFTAPGATSSTVAATDCDGGFPCWLDLTDTGTGRTTRLDSPVAGNGFYGGGAFSPDGAQLAVFVATNTGTSNPAADLGLVEVPTHRLRLVGESHSRIGEPYGYASWAPSGQWLFFDGLTGDLRVLRRGTRSARALHLAGSYSLVALNRADVATGATQVPVPSLTGQTVTQAKAALASVGLVLGIEPRLDSDDPEATVVAEEPLEGTTVVAGTTVGVRTAAPRPTPARECPKAATTLAGPAERLPTKGQTDLDRVRTVIDANRTFFVQTYGADRVVLAHRAGQVAVFGSGASRPAVEQADDYEIVAELPNRSSCPAVPASWQGVPIAFVPQ